MSLHSQHRHLRLWTKFNMHLCDPHGTCKVHHPASKLSSPLNLKYQVLFISVGRSISHLNRLGQRHSAKNEKKCAFLRTRAKHIMQGETMGGQIMEDQQTHL